MPTCCLKLLFAIGEKLLFSFTVYLLFMLSLISKEVLFLELESAVISHLEVKLLKDSVLLDMSAKVLSLYSCL